MKQFILHFKETLPSQLQADIHGKVIAHVAIVLSKVINMSMHAAIQDDMQHILDSYEDGVNPQHSEIDSTPRVC